MTSPQHTTSNDPDEIRRDIERTQDALSNDVDILTEKVSPSRIVERRVGRVRGRVQTWKDNVMGSPDPTGTPTSGGLRASASSTASSVSSTVSDAASGAADAVQDAPRAVRRQASGNPLVAGVIAFGAGWLISSLLPASRREQELAEQARDQATELGRPVADSARHALTEVKDQLTEPAQQAVASVRETATDAGQTVVAEGRDAAGQVRGDTQDAADTVRGNASAQR